MRKQRSHSRGPRPISWLEIWTPNRSATPGMGLPRYVRGESDAPKGAAWGQKSAIGSSTINMGGKIRPPWNHYYKIRVRFLAVAG